MAKKRLTPAQLKDRKTKRLAIGLSVVLVGVLAFQAPTILNLVNGGGSSNASVPPPATTSTTTASGTGAAASAGAAGSSPVAAAVFTPLAAGSLTEFGSFAGKDPFHSQLGTATAGATSATSTTPATGTTPASKAAGTTPAATTPTSPSKPKATKLAPALPVTGPTTTVPFTTTPAAPPNAAVIMTNGKRQIIPVGKGFPRGAPLFKLVSLATHPKAIRIAVLGGTFTSGAPTMLLRRGARLELANESNGLRYTIMLVGLMATASSPSGTGTSGSTG